MKKKSNIDDEIEVTGIKKPEPQPDLSDNERAFLKATSELDSKNNALYSKYIGDVSESFSTLNLDTINNLALNCQDNLDKIMNINKYIRFYLNKDDLVGRVYEIIGNNVNPDVDIIFASPLGRNKTKSKLKAEEIIKQFNKSINLSNLKSRAIPTTYSEGNFVFYLRNNEDNWKIDCYPLGIVEISDFEIDGEPIVMLNIDELKSKLQEVGYKDKKGKGFFATTIDEQIQKSYPEEVYTAYKQKEKYVILNPERTGVMRVNNLNRRYGLSAIFKTLPPQVILDVIETSDMRNTTVKGKKIIVQLLRKEVMGEEYKNTAHFTELEYAHSNFVSAWKNEIVIVTAPGYVEDIKYVEPKVEATPITTINYYRTKILTALGISFVDGGTGTSYTSAEINVKELAKNVNKIAGQLDRILEKFYKVVLTENGLEEYTPTVRSWDSEELSTELKLKIADAIFNKFGGSFRTVYELIGVDYDTEVERRQEEADNNIQEIMKPHLTGFTANGESLNDGESNTEGESKTQKKEDNQNKDKDKQKKDQDNYKGNLKNKE